MKIRHIFALMALFLFTALLLSACSHSNNGQGGDEYYTCTMHPSVRSKDPHGKCPICGMDLVPVKPKTGASGVHDHSHALEKGADTNLVEQPTEFTVPIARQQLIGVTYATVEKRPLQTTLRTVGTVTYDKQRHWDFVSRNDGYVQDLKVSSPGDVVEKGGKILSIYSPDVLTTQREFLNLLKMRDEAEKAHSEAARQSAESLIESAKRRLLQWNLTTNQITELEQTREVTDTITLYSPFKGVVQNLQVDQGRRVSMGDHLVDVADLSMVWVWAQFYQDELPLLKKGAPVTITSDAFPGEKFNGTIAVVDPFINETTRTIRVRVDIQNPELKLRPEMYVNISLESNQGESLTVPVAAVMPTGERNVAFVDKGEGRLEPRFVETGKKYGDYYAVKSGLSEGERVVNSANFLIDAESKVQGALKSW
jgi:membrane fusion protein, copper/silver efflux system